VNYRHAFHAGNHADCLKHALLLALLGALRRKDTAFGVADMHAGRGAYDLSGPEASRTGEWRAGIGKLLADTPGPLSEYVTLVQRLGLYPGSPALIRALLRERDRLVLNEKQPEEFAALTLWAMEQGAGDDPRITLRQGDAYALKGAVPPAGMKRGLVLFDAPFEAEDEMERLIAALVAAHRAAPTLILAAWYPVKHLAPVRGLRDRLAEARLPRMADAALYLRPPLDPARLNGSGLMVINAPYRFDEVAMPILTALQARLADPEGEVHLAVAP
jgi:23S rRNA (adenine2030-N6)-methyltransferase